MAVRPFAGPERTWAASTALLLLVATGGLAAQERLQSAPLTVAVTVVRPCSVDTAAGPQAAELVRIRCGRATSVYSFQPGVGATPSSGTPSGPVVTRTADGRTVTIQF